MTYNLGKWHDNSLREPRYRRRLKWACILPYLALPPAFLMEVSGLANEPSARTFFKVLTLIGMAGALFSFFAPVLRKADFDEREKDLIARVHAYSFGVLGILVYLGFGYAWLAMRNAWWLPNEEADVGALFKLIGFTVPILPVLIAEWFLLPPPVEDD